LYALSLHIQHKTNGLCDSHGVSGETFFGPRLKIEYVDALGFCWSSLMKPGSLTSQGEKCRDNNRVKEGCIVEFYVEYNDSFIEAERKSVVSPRNILLEEIPLWIKMLFVEKGLMHMELDRMVK
jgi:hypothetical protein